MLWAADSITGVLQAEFADLIDPGHVCRSILRLTLAMLLGGLLGFQRQWTGKDAGVRTHMLVAVGSAFLVLIAQQADMSSADLSRVIQGIVAGIGFIGGGVILKHVESGRISGLTTAAGLWLTSAVGVSIGLGRLGVSLVGSCLALLILSLVTVIESRFTARNRNAEHPRAATNQPKSEPSAEGRTRANGDKGKERGRMSI